MCADGSTDKQEAGMTARQNEVQHQSSCDTTQVKVSLNHQLVVFIIYLLYTFIQISVGLLHTI